MRLSLAVAAVCVALVPAPASAQEATPSPAPPPERCGGWPSFTSDFSPAAIVAGQPATYTLTITGPVHRASIGLHGYQWRTPSERADIGGERGGSYDGGSLEPGETATVTLRATPTGNAKVQWAGAVYCGPGSFHGDHFASNPETVDVAPRFTLDAVRNGPRDYTFSGTASRPGQVLNLYRVNADGSQVLTSQARATSAGTWSIRRVFLGSGRFGFVLRTGRDMANAPGASRVRDTVLH